MKNPYWHPHYKPHTVDLDEIKRLCFDLYSIAWASSNNAGTGITYDDGEEKEEVTNLERLHHEMAEVELSKKLLRLAVLVRTFDDVMTQMEDAKRATYIGSKLDIEARVGSFGAVYEGAENIVCTIRECSNKIIHAHDVRPIYESEDDRDDPGAKWGMTSEIELEGTHGGKGWHISLHLFEYLEGVISIADLEI